MGIGKSENWRINGIEIAVEAMKMSDEQRGKGALKTSPSRTVTLEWKRKICHQKGEKECSEGVGGKQIHVLPQAKGRKTFKGRKKK